MRPTLRQITTAAARYFHIPRERFELTRSRLTYYVYPRQVAMYLARRQTTASFMQIGRHFHRDHTCVMLACDRIAARLAQADGEVRADVLGVAEALAALVQGRAPPPAPEIVSAPSTPASAGPPLLAELLAFAAALAAAPRLSRAERRRAAQQLRHWAAALDRVVDAAPPAADAPPRLSLVRSPP